MKILLISGHGNGDPGACSSYGIEATETRRVVNELKRLFGGYNCSVDIYPTNRNAYADIGNGCLQVNFANYDYVLEIHFNSSASSSSNGVEVWVTPIEQGITVEQAIVNKVASLGFSNRGVKREDFRVIRIAKNRGVSSALIETCFISNQSDMAKYNSKFSEVCNAIVEGVAQGFGLTKKVNSSNNNQNNSNNKEEYKMKYAVCYCNEVDERSAKLLRDYLGDEAQALDARIKMNWYKFAEKALINIGGNSASGWGFSSYATHWIKGDDRYSTAQLVSDVCSGRKKLDDFKIK